MKKLILLLLVLGISCTGSWAQQYESVYLEQVNQQENYLPQVIEGNNFYSSFAKIPIISLLQQIAVDADQVAKITQKGDRNEAVLTQIGTNNIGAIFIKGSDNTTSLDQNGTGLLSVLNIRGNFNEMNIDQTGQALQNYVQVTGNGVEMNILQNANGIRLTQIRGESAVPLEIESEGQSIPIIIRNN